MNCENCGKPIPEGQSKCDCCNPAPQIPAEQPAFDVNFPVKEQKAKGGKIVLAVAALALVVIVALTAIFWGNISGYISRNFGDPVAYLQDVEKENAAAFADELAEIYDQAMEAPVIQNPAVKETITLELSDTLVALVQTALAGEGVNADLSWVKNIVLSPYVEVYEKNIRIDIGLGLNNVNVVTISMIMDTGSNMIYIGIPEIHETYISLDATEYMDESMGSMEETMFMSQNLGNAMMEAMPESEEIKELLVKYVGIIAEGFTQAERESRTVQVGTLEQELLVISVNLTQEEILQIANKVLEAAKNDEVIKGILNDFQAAMETVEGDVGNLYESFSMGVDNALEEIAYAMESVKEGNFLTIETFLDDEDVVVGRTFTVTQDGESESIYYIAAAQGDQWAFQMEAAEYSVSGQGTQKKDVYSGSYTVSVEDTKYFTLELENCSEASGTLRMIPEAVMCEMMGLTGPYATLLGQASVYMTYADENVTLGVEAAGTTFVALAVSVETTEAQPIALPISFDFNDDAAGMQWLSGISFDTVLDKLNQIGLPAEYMTAIEQIANMFNSQFT